MANDAKMSVRDIMIPRGQCLAEDETVAAAALRMAQLRTVPVFRKDGECAGFVTAASIARSVGRGDDVARLTVGAMLGTQSRTRRTVRVPPETTVENAYREIVWSGADHLLVVDEGTVLGVIPWQDIEALAYVPPDRLPLPPDNLMRLVMGGDRWRLPRMFYESGARMASVIRALLDRNGTPIEEFGSMLDFGCGCGRVIRHWKDADVTTICGSDYNPLLVDWCRDNLGFAEFNVNELTPGLPHEDGRFDFIYALSVFTHLPRSCSSRGWPSSSAFSHRVELC